MAESIQKQEPGLLWPADIPGLPIGYLGGGIFYGIQADTVINKMILGGVSDDSRI